MTFIVFILQGCNPFGSKAEVAAPVGSNYGNSGSAELESSLSSYDFSNVVINTASAEKVFTITNNGSAAPGECEAPTILGTNSSLFTLSTNTCSEPLAVNESCNLGVTFTPTSIGSKSASITYDCGTENTISISLTGTGDYISFTTSWDFLTAGDYTYDTNYVEISSGAASLKTVDVKTDTESEFDAGTYFGTDFDGSRLTLANNGGCDATNGDCYE